MANEGELFGTVGDILRENPVLPGEGVPEPAVERTLPARLDGQPEFPEPGIYFGMPEDVYHSINAFSASGAKALSVSSMDWWAGSVLNPEREDDESKFKALGRAYHVRICEGASVYALRYATGLDKADYPDALVSTDDLISAIIEAGHTPVSRIETGQMKPAPTQKEPDRMKPVTRAAKKEDLVAQLLDIAPDAQIWDVLQAQHAAAHEGRTFINAKQNRRIEIAARMIENDPDLRKAFIDGHAEVAIFWFDERTGCPMKAKLDYLKLAAIVDLKSFSNPFGRPVNRAIDFTISGQKHYIGVVVYTQAVEAAKRLIRKHGASVVHWCDPVLDKPDDLEAWCLRLAKVKDQPTALWVYQQTGAAPVTRGRIQVRGTVYTVTAGGVDALKKRYVECTKAFGTDPWLDIQPITETTDEDIPLSATDF